jgi:hypothetical protein
MNPFSKNLFFTELSDNNGIEWISSVAVKTLEETLPKLEPWPVKIEKNYYQGLETVKETLPKLEPWPVKIEKKERPVKIEKKEPENKEAEIEEQGVTNYWGGQSRNQQTKIAQTINDIKSKINDPNQRGYGIPLPTWLHTNESANFMKFARDSGWTMDYYRQLFKAQQGQPAARFNEAFAYQKHLYDEWKKTKTKK